MWGVTSGSVTLREGDFVESVEVSEWVRKADVVLVNNYIFSSDRESSASPMPCQRHAQ
jgi:H3 lysine-79-specific histone-lysine N-methyltransferase